jgi:hypothetical protein
MTDKYAKLEQYVRAPHPVLPESQIKYLQEELRKLEVSLQGAYGALTSSGPFIQLPHAMLMSDQDQASAGVTSENLITYNQVVGASGIRVEDNSKIWFDNPGKYLVTFSLQFTNRGNAAQEIEVWAKDGASNYALSNTRFDIAARKSTSVWSHQVAAVSGIFDVVDPALDYLQIAWWSNGPDVFLEHYAAGTTPDRPAIPSVIVTVNFVSGL